MKVKVLLHIANVSMLPMLQCYQCSQLPHGQCDRTGGGDDLTQLQGSPSWKQVCLKNLCFPTCFLFQECVLVKARPNTSADRWKIHLHIRPQVNSPFRVPWQDTFTPLCCVVLNSSPDTLSTSFSSKKLQPRLNPARQFYQYLDLQIHCHCSHIDISW